MNERRYFPNERQIAEVSKVSNVPERNRCISCPRRSLLSNVLAKAGLLLDGSDTCTGPTNYEKDIAWTELRRIDDITPSPEGFKLMSTSPITGEVHYSMINASEIVFRACTLEGIPLKDDEQPYSQITAPDGHKKVDILGGDKEAIKALKGSRRLGEGLADIPDDRSIIVEAAEGS